MLSYRVAGASLRMCIFFVDLVHMCICRLLPFVRGVSVLREVTVTTTPSRSLGRPGTCILFVEELLPSVPRRRASQGSWVSLAVSGAVLASTGALVEQRT